MKVKGNMGIMRGKDGEEKERREGKGKEKGKKREIEGKKRRKNEEKIKRGEE